jgi:hypothetical protein
LLGDVVGLVVGGDDANAEETRQWIDEDGGVLKTGPYTLVVPAGAVSGPTLFEISPTNTGTYSVDLTATQKSRWRGTVNVGAQGFKRPVTLKMSYSGADNLKDGLRLVIVYVTENGVEIQPSRVDASSKTVSGTLNHFSKYALVQN